MSERGKSLRIQKHTEDFERRLKTMQNDIVKLKSIFRNVNNPANDPVSVAATPSPDPPSDHGKLLGLDDDDHLQYLLHTDNIVKTGWDIGLDETDVTIAMTDGSRTFTITPIAAMTYFILGVEYSLAEAKTVVIDDTEGLWYIYFVGTTLTASQTPWEIADGDKCMIAIVYWDATNNATITIGWQLHSHFMAAGTHDYAHHSFGTRYASGLAVTDAGADLLNVAAGIIFDEDIEIGITDGAGSDLFEQVLSPAELPILYRDGAAGNWRKVAATTRPVHLVANVLQLNELNGAWALANVTNNSYIAYWILATDDISEPIISIPGQVEGTNIVNVRENNPISSMDFGNLPIAEFRVIARLIVKGLVGGIFYEVSAIDDFRAVSNEPGTTTPNIHASSHFANGVDELLLDEDNMVSDLATKGSSQQAIKAYVDAQDHLTAAQAVAAAEAEDPFTHAGHVDITGNITARGTMMRGIDNDFTLISGGSTAILGSNIKMWGEGHANANDFAIRVDETNVMLYDQSVATWSVLGTVKNKTDSGGFYTGADDDFRMYHDGSNAVLINTTGKIFLQTQVGGTGDIHLLLGGEFRVRDIDDSGEDLLVLDTSNRLFVVGAIDGNDNIASSFYGTVKNPVDNAGLYTGAGDDLRLYHDGTDSYIVGITGALIIRDSTVALRCSGFWGVQDTDDANVNLILLNTTTRVHTIGLAADPVTTTHTGTLNIAAGNLIMDGAGGDDERLKVPYLTGVPASVDNGSVWMEADGLHIYYAGAEKVVAGA